MITREKLIRLQTLYIEQFKRLKHVMQEKRRKLIATKSAEKTKYGSIYGAKTDSKEKRRLERYRFVVVAVTALVRLFEIR